MPVRLVRTPRNALRLLKRVYSILCDIYWSSRLNIVIDQVPESCKAKKPGPSEYKGPP